MSLVSHCASGAWDAALAALPTASAAAISDVAGPSSWTSLHFAAAAPAAPAALLLGLLDIGAPIDAVGSSGSTPLHLAAWHGCASHLTLLLSRGASVLAVTRARRSPLHFAARRGHAHIVELLVAAGADVNHPDAKGMTALHFAADGAHEAVAHILVAAGAVCVPANDGRNALDVARAAGSTEIIDALRAAFGDEGVLSELGVNSMTRRISDVEDIVPYDATATPGSRPDDSQQWLGGRLVSALSSKATALARQVLPPKAKANGNGERTSLAGALSAMSGEELAQTMGAYAVKGQSDAVAAEYSQVIERAVVEYRLTGELLLAKSPAARTLVQELLETGGVEREAAGKGALFHTLVNFVDAARAAQGGTLVQTTVQKGKELVVRKEVYVAVGAGVLFSLLIPLARKK